MPDPVLRQVEDGVGILSLNRPEKHNALDDGASEAFRKALEWAIGAPDARGLETGLAAALENEAYAEELAIRSLDFKEGLRAFRERRKPDFKGR